MRVIARPLFKAAKVAYPRHAAAVERTYQLLSRGKFANINEFKQTFATTERFEYEQGWYCVNVAGNHLRLLLYLDFESQICFAKFLVDHKEYDEVTDEFRRRRKRGKR